MIRYLNRKQIDDEIWNRVISDSVHETAYAYSWYLDACADHWGGWIFLDYECIMPVVFRKKFGVKYTYMPRFCQQLGVFSAKRIDPEITRIFLKELRKKFRFGDYSFNASNVLGDEPGFEVSDNTNYILDLNKEYHDVAGNYSSNCNRNIRKASESPLEFTDQISINEVVALKKFQDRIRRADDHYDFLVRMYKKLDEKGKIEILGARYNNRLVSGAVFVRSGKRILYLLSASDQTAKTYRGMFLILDQCIARHAGEKRLLDLEGSNIPGVARFFMGFGARPEIYQRISFKHPANKIIKIIRGV